MQDGKISFTFYHLKIHWRPLFVIMVNIIIRLILSNIPIFLNGQLSNIKVNISKSFLV
jgi:hypothetical protein